WANPCKHVAAVHFVLGEAFDRDPFLLFELRGRTKAQVLDALRAARGGEPEAGGSSSKRRRAAGVAAKAEAPAVLEVVTVSLGRMKTEDYDSPRSPLPSLRFHFDAPEAPGALLRQLGAPNGWSDARTPAERLG